MNRYFVLIEGPPEKIMEIDEELYNWLSSLGITNVKTGEPNLFIVEKYKNDSLFLLGNKIERAYAGISSEEIPSRSFHYFIHLRPTRQKPFKQKPFLLQEYRRSNNENSN